MRLETATCSSSLPSNTSPTSDSAGTHRDIVAIAAAAAAIASLMSAGGLIAQAVSALPSIQHLNLYPDRGSCSRRARACLPRWKPSCRDRNFHVVAIGSGPAGQKVAIQCAKRGRRVAAC